MDGNNFLDDRQNENTVNTPSPPLADIIGKLMSDPQILSTLSSVIGKGSNTKGQGDEKNNIEATAAEEAPPSPPATDVLASRLPQMMEALAPMLSAGNEKKGADGILNGALSKQDDKRICLLRAIKPYVSRGRSEAIDYMIQISKLSELMKHLN